MTSACENRATRWVLTLTLIIAALALAAPRAAQAEPASPPLSAKATPVEDEREGRPLEDELSDAARDAARKFIELVAPLLTQLEFAISDLPSYHAPEILPNGDILIRRKREGAEDQHRGDKPPSEQGPEGDQTDT